MKDHHIMRSLLALSLAWSALLVLLLVEHFA
jgi:hypothetical protein